MKPQPRTVLKKNMRLDILERSTVKQGKALKHVCFTVGIFLSLLLAACGTRSHSGPENGPVREIPGTQIRMDFSRQGGFYSAPFPSDDLKAADGSVDISGFPNPDNISFVNQLLEMIRTGTAGFGLTTAVYFQVSGPLDRDSLPDLHASLLEDSPVFLMGVDPASPDYLRRYPVDVHFTEDGGPFGCSNLLSLLPLQGIPLRPVTTYAAVVMRDVLDAGGERLGVSLPMAQIAAGQRPSALDGTTFTGYGSAVNALAGAGVDTGRLAGMAVFTTGNPAQELGLFRESVLLQPHPEPNRGFVRNEVFDDYCVYETTINMPVFQQGNPPFFFGGGGWVVDASGNPVLQKAEEANFVLTVPREDMPAEGFPIVVFSRTGGGGERPLVDRGQRAEPGGEAIEPGSGPAREFARVGFAGASVDGPHGGLRNVTGLDEQILVFNFLNPTAMRDNIRQSALEIILLTHILEDIRIDATDCPGVSTPEDAPVIFDVTQMALMGHSTGATIIQPVLAFEPRFQAAVMSGAGGSYIGNLVYKKRPVEVKPLAELILKYHRYGRELHEHDPAMSLAQWAGEPSDPPVYNQLFREGSGGVKLPHILMLQGIVDNYILPPIANASSLSLGLDLAGDSLDRDHPELQHFRALEDLVCFSGREKTGLPVQGNVLLENGARKTAVVVQHLGDGIEDGHEVVFQTDPPKHQYRCFLQTFLAGLPFVPVPDECP